MGPNKNIWNNDEIVKIILDGGVVVMPTDTVYGMVGKAKDPSLVERIYKIRDRDPQKPFIILISSADELANFSINLSPEQKNILNEYWPGPFSFILDCPNEEFSYLHRGAKTLAFRVPAPAELRELLSKTGPLVAPSANLEKFPESESVEDAEKYFGSNVDMYVDGGEIKAKASKIIRLHPDGAVSIIRA